MSMTWKTTQYSVKNIIEFENSLELELRPDFQRHSVWSHAAKIMLIDSILRDIPMPKIYVHIKQATKGKTIRSIIDGQQRIRAILEFVTDPKFKLVDPYSGPYKDYTYKKFIDNKLSNKILDYKIDINEIHTDSDKLVREIYSRVNKYTVALNSQELRRADFPGDFLAVSERLSILDFFDDSKMFTAADRRRMRDVEYVSELISAIIGGPQDKKESLDSYYITYSRWDKKDKESVIQKFQQILADVANIFPKESLDTRSGELHPFNKTRFRQKSDFYSLVVAINELHNDGFSLKNKSLDILREDLALLDNNITPESEIELFSKYAIMCTSQANTLGSRTWRGNLLKDILSGTYIAKYPDARLIRQYHYALWDLYTSHTEMGCPAATTECIICGEEFDNYSDKNARLMWPQSSEVFQMSNATFVHKHCFAKNNLKEYISSDTDEVNG